MPRVEAAHLRPAGPPRDTIHVTQHLLLDGFRILRAQTPKELIDDELLADLDHAISLLEPMRGIPIRDPGPRLYGLAHGLRVLIEDLLPYVNTTAFDGRQLPAVLERLQARLAPLRDAGYKWAPGEKTSSEGRTDLDVR